MRKESPLVVETNRLANCVAWTRYHLARPVQFFFCQVQGDRHLQVEKGRDAPKAALGGL